MMKVIFTLSALLALPLTNAFAADLCPKPWVCEKLEITSPTTVKIRAGYYPEKGTFRGNILYFEGLGDSMVNHAPFFSELSEAGFRVIAFDYMGLGGSEGKMNRTRIRSIPVIGEQVWQKFARELATYPKKRIVGWSTGGLAAYYAASKGNADQIVMIAPGIAPKTDVGTGYFSWPMNQITPESLTTAAPYASGEENPHVDAIRPNSPLKVPFFSSDLIATAAKMRKTPVDAKIRGFVLLSGDEDTYVDAAKTRKAMALNAPHFTIQAYAGALHEIDNERTEIARAARADIVNFLARE